MHVIEVHTVGSLRLWDVNREFSKTICFREYYIYTTTADPQPTLRLKTSQPYDNPDRKEEMRFGDCGGADATVLGLT